MKVRTDRVSPGDVVVWRQETEEWCDNVVVVVVGPIVDAPDSDGYEADVITPQGELVRAWTNCEYLEKVT